MLLPDDIIINKNCSLDMIKLHKKYKSSVIASIKVKRKDVSRWGIFNLKKINKRNFLIKDVIEKPKIKNAPSNYAVIGRYLLSKNIFKILKKQKKGKNGEIHITDAIRTLVKRKNKFIGHIFDGKYLDCGTMKGYINSTIEISITITYPLFNSLKLIKSRQAIFKFLFLIKRFAQDLDTTRII